MSLVRTRLLLGVCGMAFVIQCAFFACLKLYVIPTGSMEPSYYPGDRVIVLRRWASGEPKTGDIVAMESPVDLGNCGKEVVKSLSPDMQKNALLYIASDSQDSSQQINDTINWPLTIVQGKACHVNLNAGPACKSMTLVHWFTLALSDKIVIQSIIAADSKTHIPPSGFSRFATIYALQQDAPAFGLSCSHGDKLLMSQLNQGNWICDPPA